MLQTDRAFLAPRDSVELKLVSIWEDVFKTYPIGVEDNFFDLGGHSILAVKLMARINKEFNEGAPVKRPGGKGARLHILPTLFAVIQR